MTLPQNAPFTFGVRRAIIAVWNGDGSYDDAVHVPGIKTVSIQSNTTNAQQEGDDQILAVASKIVSGTVNWTQARISFEVLNVILNQTIQSGSSFKALKVTNKKSRYFGLAFVVDEAEGDGDVHIFVPKMKLQESLSLNFGYGEFTSPEATFMAVLDSHWADEDGDPCLFYPIQHEDRQTLVIPPVLALTDESEE
jgi:hypothetical protein